MNILLVTSSPRGSASHSTQIARALAERLAVGKPGANIVVRDLAAAPLPHINDAFAVARELPPEKLTAAQRETLRLSDALVQELVDADVVVLGAGMINFGVPSTLKAYIDHILRPGVTFRYTPKGPEGLVTGKKVYLVVARGGVYSQGKMQALNFQDTYLRAALGFIGLTDLEVIAVEGVAFGPDAARQAIMAALARVSDLAA
jgi:FMN-dependent NADH-azoreductase